jgi:hypothetical protein
MDSVIKTDQPESSAEQVLAVKLPRPKLLVQGFLLALRNWPLVVWAYVINLLFGLLAGIPFTTGLVSYLDHSMAAQRIAGSIDISMLRELELHLRDGSFFPAAIQTAGWINALELLVLFFFFTGTVFIYVSAEQPWPSTFLRGAVTFFWRFVRAGILVGCVIALIQGILFALRGAILARAGETHFERALFYYSAISGAVIFLVAVLLRLWFDLVQIYIVRNDQVGERRVRQALLPAFRLLSRNFFRATGGFLLSGLAGLSALALCLYLWNEFVPAHQVWIAFLLAQLGLFVLLASRFWQRGFEAALVMALDPPVVALPIVVIEEITPPTEPEEAFSLAGVAGLPGMAEPTLMELVQKLRSEPWPRLDSSRPSLTDGSDPGSGEGKAEGEKISIVDRHATKLRLGGEDPQQEPPSSSSPEAAQPDEEPKKPVVPEEPKP